MINSSSHKTNLIIIKHLYLETKERTWILKSGINLDELVEKKDINEVDMLEII